MIFLFYIFNFVKVGLNNVKIILFNIKKQLCSSIAQLDQIHLMSWFGDCCQHFQIQFIQVFQYQKIIFPFQKCKHSYFFCDGYPTNNDYHYSNQKIKHVLSKFSAIYGTYNQIMIIVIATLIVFLAFYIAYKFYLKPKRQIKRYLNVFKSLGYTVYQMPFMFMGLSIIKDFQRGLKNHKDAMYYEKALYSQVDIAIGNILDKVLVDFVNPDLMKCFLSGSVHLKYPKYQLMIRGQKAVLGNGLVFSEGEVWRSKRKLLSKAFSFDLIKANIPKITQICNSALEMFEQANKVGENRYKYNLVSLGTRMFNGVMMKCFFGTDQFTETIKGQKFEQFVNTTSVLATELTYNPLIALLGKFAWNAGLTKKIRQAKEGIDLIQKKSSQIVRKITEKVMNQPKKENTTFIIQALIYAKMENKEEVSFSDQDLVEEFQTFLVAGTDTTARLLTMMIYYLANKPEALNRLRKEIDAVIKSDEDITFQNLKKLTYIDWCQQETTRLYGPGNGVFPRITSEDNFINDIPIAKDTIVSIQPRGNHYNPKYFKDPEEFRPERWESECDGIHPFALLGFSAGNRSCVGKQLSYMESKIGLIKFLMRYQTVEAPKQVTFRMNFVYEPVPFDMIFTKKASQK